MYPDLSYLFHDLFGTPRDNWLSIFKTFGLMLVTAILIAAWLLRLELQRRARIGQLEPVPVKVVTNRGLSPVDFILNGVIGFLIGFKGVLAVQQFELLKRDPAGLLFSLEGSWLGGVIGLVLFLAYYGWQDRQLRRESAVEQIVDRYPHDRIGTITTIAAISGVVGAKVFAILEDLPTFFNDPVGTFFSGSGLAIYGGLIGGFLGCYFYLRRHNIPIVPVLDAVAPALIIGYGVGRIGCQLAGDGDWGIVAAAQPEWWFLPEWLWEFTYPHNVLREGVPIPGCSAEYCRQLPEGVYPTPVYETAMAFTIGGILWALRKPLTAIPGLLFSIYLLLNGIERWFIEKIRVNIRYETFSNLTQAEIIAIGFMSLGILLGLVFYIYAKRRKKRAAATTGP